MKYFFCHYQYTTEDMDSFSPSSWKPASVVGDWINRKLVGKVDHRNPRCLEAEDMYIAHDKAYIDGIMDCTIANGFGNKSQQVASTIRFTTGSMLSAAEYAIEHNEHTCSPTSGFHHAGHDFGGGYCTVNGLMITAMTLQQTGQAESIGILDLDAHFGNGTADIIKRKNVRNIVHRTAGSKFHTRRDVSDGKYFFWLQQAINDMCDCDVILYQAGADPFIEDSLGGMLTEKELQQRDQLVFECFNGKPLAWNLAGGYARDEAGTIEPVLRLHRNTAIECIKAAG